MSFRTCNKCGVNKPLTKEYWHRHPKAREGFNTICAVCITAAQVERHQRLREDAVECLGGRCAHCGNDDRRVLEVDHVDGGGCDERRQMSWFSIMRRVLRGEPGYQVLCANCHRIKTWDYNHLTGKDKWGVK